MLNTFKAKNYLVLAFLTASYLAAACSKVGNETARTPGDFSTTTSSADSLARSKKFAEGAITVTCDSTQVQCKNPDGSASPYCCFGTNLCHRDPNGNVDGCHSTYRGQPPNPPTQFCQLEKLACPDSNGNIKCCNLTQRCEAGECKNTVCSMGGTPCGADPHKMACCTETQVCRINVLDSSGKCEDNPADMGRCSKFDFPTFPCSISGNLNAKAPETLCCDAGSMCQLVKDASGKSVAAQCCPPGTLIEKGAAGPCFHGKNCPIGRYPCASKDPADINGCCAFPSSPAGPVDAGLDMRQ